MEYISVAGGTGTHINRFAVRPVLLPDPISSFFNATIPTAYMENPPRKVNDVVSKDGIGLEEVVALEADSGRIQGRVVGDEVHLRRSEDFGDFLDLREGQQFAFSRSGAGRRRTVTRSLLCRSSRGY